MLEDFKLKVFVEAAREKSFTRAAAKLHISQPAVSQNIADLEKLLGARLFERRRGEVALTAAGEVFMTRAEAILEEYSRTEDIFSRLPKTEVRLSVPEEVYSHMVAPALEAFMKIHPEVSFVRHMFSDADVCIFLRPADASVLAVVPDDSIARVRVSVSVPRSGRGLPYDANAGSHMATREKTSYYDVVFQPSPAFSCTKLCRLLRSFLIS